jgi:TP901 family phage tail tape measure protein
MTDLRIGVDADTRQAEAKIAKLADRPIKLNLKNSISQPLGRITGQVSEFNKSLEASNARVLAFGASAGSIFVVQKALNATLKSAIDVEKALLDINVVLGVSSKSLATFGSALFDIAKNTGQSFEVVATAATELARQGLSVQQTLQRTSDALILTRLSGLDTVASVEALTAAVNTFSKAGITSTQIINKFANVDAGFAVSSADLAEAISRVGSTAQDVGVDLDQLIALVTAAQQTTARGGSVIGNSFKTIFTRLQRSDTLDALEEVGIKVRDLEGEALPAIQILNNLAGSFQNLSKSQQAATAEAVGGVFQINVLRSTLGDLGKEYSIYDGALRTSASSTNEAIKRNEALNASLSSLVNKTFVNLNQAAAEIGKIVFAPAATETLDAFNLILEAFNQPKETEGIGTKVAKGILGGLGNYLSGPGLAVIGTVFIKLFGGLTAFSANALKTLLNISSETDKIAQAQSRVNELLAQNPQLIQAVMSKEMSLLQVEEQILNVIRQQNAARVTASTITTSVAKRVPAPRKYGGFIPNFADAEIMGARSEGYNAQRSFEVNNPVLGRVTVNNREKTNSVPVGGYPAGSFIVNPNQLGQVAGVPLESIDRMRNKGFIPNFSKEGKAAKQFAYRQILKKDYVQLGGAELKRAQLEQNNIFLRDGPSGKNGDGTLVIRDGEYFVKKDKKSIFTNQLRQKERDTAENRGQKESGKIRSTSVFIYPDPQGGKGFQSGGTAKDGTYYKFPIFPFPGGKKEIPDLLYNNISQSLVNVAKDYISGITTRPNLVKNDLFENYVRSNLSRSAVEASTGQVFEAAIKASINRLNTSEINNMDLDHTEIKAIASRFKGANGLTRFQDGDFKNSLSESNLDSFANKLLFKDTKGKNTKGKNPKKFGGFIPNFAALEEAVQREKSAGIASSMIRIGANEGLRNNNNPMGLGVYNTRDEPSGLGQGISRRRSKGFIPNFASKAFDEDYRAKVRGAGGNSLDRFSKSVDKASAALSKMAQSSNQAATANQNEEKAASRTSGFMQSAADKALALSIALPIVTGIISQFGDQTSKTAKFIDRTSTLVTDAATGVTLFTSLLGKNGAALGALSGSALGVYQIFDQINKQNKENFLNPLKTNAESASEALQQLNGNIQDVASPLNQVIQDQKDGAEISAEALSTLAEKINNLPLNIQEQVRPSLESGNFEGILKTLQTASSKAERESKSKSLAAGIGQKMVNAKKGENGGFIDIYGDAKAAASDAQDVINNVFSGLNKTEITELNKRLQESGGNFLKINQILQQAAKDTDADASALKELNLAFQTGATNGKELAKQMLKQAAAIEKNTNAVKKTKVPVLGQKQDLTGAGNILGGKESFINPQERYASISQFAAGASKYVEGNRTGDIDTKGRGAYEMLSNLVQSGNVNPKDLLMKNNKGDFTNGLVASASAARKAQIIEGAKRKEEIYKSTLAPGQKADPAIMKQFQDMQNNDKAQQLADKSIEEFLMTDAQKTYAAFAPTLQEMLGALELLKAGPDNENLIQQLSVLSQNILGPGGKAEEQRAKMGQSKEDFYGYDFQKTGEISPGSTYGRMVAQAGKGKYNTPEAKAINEQLKGLSYPSITNPESRLTEIPANGSAGRGPGMSDKKDLNTAQNAMLSTTELITKTFNGWSTELKAATIAVVGLATAAAALTTVLGVKESLGGGKGDKGGLVEGLTKGAGEQVGKTVVGGLINTVKGFLGGGGGAAAGEAVVGETITTAAAAEGGALAGGGLATTIGLPVLVAAISTAVGYGIGKIPTFGLTKDKDTGENQNIHGALGDVFAKMFEQGMTGHQVMDQKEGNALLQRQVQQIKAASEAKKQKEQENNPTKTEGTKSTETKSTVDISPINANVNITATPDATTIAKIAGLEAVMQNFNEQLRSLKAQNGENVPPSIFSQSAQSVALTQ